MTRYLVPVVLLAFLSGCGVAETAATAGAVAQAEAQNAKAAQEMAAKIEKQAQDAQAVEAARLKAAEDAAQ